MPARLAEADQMTVDEFLAFTAARPEGERWELVEGVAVMNPSPTEWHQRIVLNIAAALDDAKKRTKAPWLPLLGVGTRVPVSPNSLPQPDLFIKAGAPSDSSVSDDAIVVFEVLSKSNTRLDRAWRRRVYASVPNCQHYVTVSTKTAAVVRHDRSEGREETPIAGLHAVLQLPAINARIPLVEIYRWTPIE